MSRKPSPLSPEDKLNKIAPGAAEVGLGSIIDELITMVNTQRAVINALVTKLNADTGVNDADYAGVTSAALTPLSQR